MVSSAAEPRVRRTMGDECGSADPILRAKVFDYGADGRLEVVHGLAVGFEALAEVVP